MQFRRMPLLPQMPLRGLRALGWPWGMFCAGWRSMPPCCSHCTCKEGGGARRGLRRAPGIDRENRAGRENLPHTRRYRRLHGCRARPVSVSPVGGPLACSVARVDGGPQHVRSAARIFHRTHGASRVAGWRRPCVGCACARGVAPVSARVLARRLRGHPARYFGREWRRPICGAIPTRLPGLRQSTPPRSTERTTRRPSCGCCATLGSYIAACPGSCW